MKGKLITIAGQKIYDCGEHLHLHLREPWWGAYSKFHWENGVAGVGVSEDLLKYAKDHKRVLKLSFYKNRSIHYLISPKHFIQVALLCGGTYLARNKIKLMVIPVTALEKDHKEEKPVEFDPEAYYKSRLRLQEMAKRLLHR